MLTTLKTGGGALERVQIFILAEGLKIEFLCITKWREQLVQGFYQSSLHFDCAYLAVHMIQGFVIILP